MSLSPVISYWCIVSISLLPVSRYWYVFSISLSPVSRYWYVFSISLLPVSRYWYVFSISLSPVSRYWYVFSISLLPVSRYWYVFSISLLPVSRYWWLFLECFPNWLDYTGLPVGVRQMLRSISECQNLPENKIVNGHRLPARAIARLSNSGIQWIAFAFESVSHVFVTLFSTFKIMVIIFYWNGARERYV